MGCTASIDSSKVQKSQAVKKSSLDLTDDEYSPTKIEIFKFRRSTYSIIVSDNTAAATPLNKEESEELQNLNNNNSEKQQKSVKFSSLTNIQEQNESKIQDGSLTTRSKSKTIDFSTQSNIYGNREIQSEKKIKGILTKKQFNIEPFQCDSVQKKLDFQQQQQNEINQQQQAINLKRQQQREKKKNLHSIENQRRKFSQEQIQKREKKIQKQLQAEKQKQIEEENQVYRKFQIKIHKNLRIVNIINDHLNTFHPDDYYEKEAIRQRPMYIEE